MIHKKIVSYRFWLCIIHINIQSTPPPLVMSGTHVFTTQYVMVFFVFNCLEVRGGCSFCWYWCPSLFNLSLHNNALLIHAHGTFNNWLQCKYIFFLIVYCGEDSSWLWSCGSWIYVQLCNQSYHDWSWWFISHQWKGVITTTLCGKVCQWLGEDSGFLWVLWFPPLLY